MTRPHIEIRLSQTAYNQKRLLGTEERTEQE